jgi:hypothetical protein
VLWLHDYVQLMLDDLVGRYQDWEKQQEQEGEARRPEICGHALRPRLSSGQ